MRNLILTALAGTAMIMASPALAQSRGGGGGGSPAGAGQGMGAGAGGIGQGRGGGIEAMGGISETGATMRAQARENSRGPANASATGIANANDNSVLSGPTVVAGPPTGLEAGDTINIMVDGTVTPVGTVSRILPSDGGRVRNVLIQLSDGRVVPVAPSTLTLDTTTGVWTTTAMRLAVEDDD